MGSDAVGLERVSRVVGYKLKKGDFRVDSPNLPQLIALLGEANEANQAGLDTTPWTFTSLQAAGTRYGYGSPLYHQLRILKPVSGDGVGGIPIVVYPQLKAVSATARVINITPTGTATANGTHYLVVAGRYGLDGDTYELTINTGDTPAIISGKIAAALNSILAAPCTATATATEAVATTKWNGLTANDFSVTVDTNNTSIGVTYATTQVTAGAGTPSISTSLTAFGSNWNTIVINGYGAVPAVMNSLESFNGIPDPSSPTGRYAGLIFKPFIAVTGSTLDDPSSLTDSRLNNVTIAIAPAPGSKGFPFEAAANMALVYAKVAQNTPHLDVQGKSYPDMPTPLLIGSMATYDSRDQMVQKGCSTVDLVAGRYVIQDFVTTYHPLGENPPQFRYVRNLNVDFNIRYGYYLLEQQFVVDHVIANDNDIVTVENVIKPKQWKQIIGNYSDNLVNRGLTVDTAFTRASLSVTLGTTNPDRFESFLRYKRSPVVRISSTTAEAGFNFGSLSN